MYYLVQRVGSNNRPLLTVGKNNQKLFTNKLLAEQFINLHMKWTCNVSQRVITEQHYLLVFDDNGDLIKKFEGWSISQIDWSKVP